MKKALLAGMLAVTVLAAGCCGTGVCPKAKKSCCGTCPKAAPAACTTCPAGACQCK